VAVVLVRPQGNLNIGSAARAMKNTGFSELVLVDPVRFDKEEASLMAVDSKEILDDARITNTLSDALSNRHIVFGVTARSRHKRDRITPPEAAALIESDLAARHRIALVFGPEDHGLSSEEIDACQHLIGIPAHPDMTSYNLSQAVLLVCHALFVKLSPAPLPEGAEPVLAEQADRERVEARVLDLLGQVEYLTPNRELILKDMVKRLVYRTPLETRDVRNILAALRHILYWSKEKEK
jgi:TrmH family RNA methyltransferase